MFNKLTKQLFPKARAWFLKKGSNIQLFFEALAESEQRLYDETLLLLDSILPDNDNFTTENATHWERALALFHQPYLTLEERKLIIKRKMQHPGDILPRQSRAYIEGELRKVGFDVYIHENLTPIDPRAAIVGTFNVGEMNVGSIGITGGYSVIANYIDERKDREFFIGGSDNLRATFFIGGEVFGTRADVDYKRKNEFREMILKLKPCQMVGFLQIDFPPEVLFLDGSNFKFLDDTQKQYLS